MKSIGRAFGFYIKYWQQMEALYSSESKDKEALLKELHEEERGKIKRAGDCASKQAGKLLKECGEKIKNHFEKQGVCTKITSQDRSIEKYWEIPVRLWPKQGRRSTALRLKTGVEAGVSFEYIKQTPVLLVYLWTRGGKEVERKLTKMLGGTVNYRLGDLGWYAGSVTVGEEIPLVIDKGGNFEIDGGILLEEVGRRLEKIGKKELKKLFEIEAF
jgi:hypothetical protein